MTSYHKSSKKSKLSLRANLKPKHSYGFTIVELLIVIVVIGILAAISIVAYTGITNSANDAAVKSDLANFAKAIRMYEAERGYLPIAGSVAPAQGGLNDSTSSNVKFRPSKSAYNTTADNFFYCSGKKSGTASFIITVRSKSGVGFIYTPEGGTQKLVAGDLYPNCSTAAGWDGVAGIDYGYNYGYYRATNTWWNWTN